MASSSSCKRRATESRFAECPICSAVVLLHRINEHLDGCVSAQTLTTRSEPQPLSARPVLPMRSENAAVGRTVSPPPAFSQADTPIAQAFGLLNAPKAAPSASADDRAMAAAECAFMPGYVNRLHDPVVHPGAGTNIQCDGRRRNSWLGERGLVAQPGSVGDSLAAVALLALEEEQASPSLLAHSEVRLAKTLAAMNADDTLSACLEAITFSLAAPSVWRRLPATGPSPTSANCAGASTSLDSVGGALATTASATSAAAVATATTGEGCAVKLHAAISNGLLELLTDAVLRPSTVGDVATALSTIPMGRLRTLCTELGVGPPPAASGSAGSHAHTAARSRAPSPSPGAAASYAEASASASARMLARHLTSTLSRRRSISTAPLLGALGPCVRMPSAAALAIRRLCALAFTAAGYSADEAVWMLRGVGGLGRGAQFGSTLAIRAHPSSRCTRFPGPSARAAFESALGILERAETSAAMADSAPLYESLHAAMAMLLNGRDDLPAASCAVLGRVVLAGCAQLRRDRRHAEAMRLLHEALQHAAMPKPWRAAAVVVWLRELQACGAKMAALRLCEVAHATNGLLTGRALERIYTGDRSSQEIAADIPSSSLATPATPTEHVASRPNEAEALVREGHPVREVPTYDAATSRTVMASCSQGTDLAGIRSTGSVEAAPSADGVGLATASTASVGAAVSVGGDTFMLSAPQLLGIRRVLLRLAVPPRRWKRPTVLPLRQAREIWVEAHAVKSEGHAGASDRRVGWLAPHGTVVGVEECVRLHLLAGRSVNGRASGDGHCAPIGNDSPAGVTWSRGEHLENAPFLALFALLMWDALFAPLPGAFGSSAQDAPDDLVRGGRGAFSGRRAAMITRLLEEIESAESAVDCHGAVHCTGEGDCSSPNEGSHSAEADQADASARGPPSLASRLATSYAAHYGTECIGIAWDRLELPLLQVTSAHERKDAPA